MKRQSLVVAVVITILFPLASFQCSLGQTDTNLLATGEWSEIVRDSDPHTTYALRGRLLVYDDQTQSAANHARVYLELQNVFEGGWSLPLEVYFDLGLPVGRRSDQRFEMHDALDKLIPRNSFQSAASGRPIRITLYCPAIRLFECVLICTTSGHSRSLTR